MEFYFYSLRLVYTFPFSMLHCVCIFWSISPRPCFICSIFFIEEFPQISVDLSWPLILLIRTLKRLLKALCVPVKAIIWWTSLEHSGNFSLETQSRLKLFPDNAPPISCLKTLMLGKTEGKRRRGWQIASSTWRTWVWANSGRWWRTEKPGLLPSMGLQKSDTTAAEQRHLAWDEVHVLAVIRRGWRGLREPRSVDGFLLSFHNSASVCLVSFWSFFFFFLENKALFFS